MKYTVRKNIFQAISLSIFASLMVSLIWLLNDILSHLDWSMPFLGIVIALILVVVLLAYVVFVG